MEPSSSHVVSRLIAQKKRYSECMEQQTILNIIPINLLSISSTIERFHTDHSA